MFNLFVNTRGWSEGYNLVDTGRFYEGTAPPLVTRFNPGGVLDLPALSTLPALVMQESERDGAQVARVATIRRAHMVGRDASIDFVFDTAVPPLPNRLIERFAADLGMERWEFSRGHWAVKDADLYRFALCRSPPARPLTTAFSLPPVASVNPRFASAMMPFGPHFNGVYEAIQGAARLAGFECRRARFLAACIHHAGRRYLD